MDLPDEKLHKSKESHEINEVSLADLLTKYSGKLTKSADGQYRRFTLVKLPVCLIFYFKRFVKNEFFVEKNKTLVSCALKGFNLRDVADENTINGGNNYNLVGNITHEGTSKEGIYKADVLCKTSNEWFEVHDIIVSKKNAYRVSLSESCLLFYEKIN